MNLLKNKKDLIINILLLIIILLSLVFTFKYSYVKESDNVKFSKEYNEISSNNKFIYKNIEEIIDTINNKTGIVFLGYPECIWCQKYVTYVNEVINSENVNEIYYLNIKYDRSNNTKSYNKLLALLNNYLEDDNGTKQLYVPNLIVVKDGSIIYNNNDTSSIDENITPDDYWTTEKIDSFKNELKEAFNQMK